MAQLTSTNVYGTLAVTGSISEGGTLLTSKYAPYSHSHGAGEYTDTKVTAVGNHYTPSGGTTKSASGATGTSGTTVQVVTGVTVDAAGHVTAVTSGAATDTTYSSKTAASGGTDVSLVTTGEKYTWNNKTSNTGTVTSVTISASSPISIDNSNAITTSGTRTISHANSGATAGSYGDSANQTPTYGGTFKVPYVTVNATGHVTGISEHTVQIPASDNTDKNVQSTTSTTNANYPILLNNGTSATTSTALIKTTCWVNPSTGTLSADVVKNAVWNDLTDRIPVDDECELEYGKVYCFDGEHYYQSQEYCPEGLIGIHSDTGGFEMGHKEGVKEMQVSVAGFVLAYVDREYPVGTALTATCCGYLTEISKKDKMEYPERILATYWKDEPSEEWGSENNKVKVNGRKWVKIK